MITLKSIEHTIKSGKFKLLDWWVGTVFFTFFPLVILVVISVCTKGTIDYFRLFGDGELILSAFLVASASLVKLHSNGTTDQYGKLLFYALLIIEFLQLVAYTSIKMDTDRVASVVYITSVSCVLASILIARASEIYLSKEE